MTEARQSNVESAPRSVPWLRPAAVVVAVLLVVAFFVLPAGGLAQLTVLALAALAAPSLLAVRLYRERLLGSRPWVLLLAATGLYGVASPFWGVLPVLTGRTLPFPSPLDAVYFASYTLSAAFLVGVLLRQNRHGSQGRRRAVIALLDAGIFAVAATAALWPLLIGPNIADPDVAGLALVVAVGYPLVSAALVGLVVRVAIGNVWTPALGLLLLWAGAELIGDIFYGYLSLTGTFTYSHPISAAWLMSYLALGALALHPGLLRLTDGESDATTQRASVWLPLGAVMLPLVVSLFDPSRLLDLVAIVGVLLVVSRLGVMSGELFDQRRLMAADLLAQRRLSTELAELSERSRDLAENNERLAERLTATFESITDGLYTLDENWRFTYLNSRAEGLLRQPREALLGRDFWEVFSPTIGTEFEAAVRRSMTEQVTVLLQEYHYPPFGSWFQVVVYPSQRGLTIYIRDVSDLRRDRQALQRMNVELGEANRRLEDAAGLKEDLLSMASHELRTPLTPILGFLEILEARGNHTADQQQMLKVMGSNAKRMLRLVDDLLAVSRVSAGAMVSHPREVPLEGALRGLCQEVGETAGPVELAVEGFRAVVDPQHLEQIVMNLLTNASKYGTPPLSVTASSADEGRIAIEVADRGDGVPADFQAHMWDRFAQKDHGDRRTASGVGLGLSIVKLLAEANDGTVSYRDGSPTGAVFTVELPGECRSEQLDHYLSDEHWVVGTNALRAAALHP